LLVKSFLNIFVPNLVTDKQLTEYDRIVYPSYTHPQTHPDRLAVIGRLFGLDPAPVGRCRVLEVGCGDGTNLAPMAWALPESEFAGVDLASRPVEKGQEMVRDLSLANLRLVQGDLTELNPDWGQFDYIIAHGLYSWVPNAVRQHLLGLCRRSLTPRGIAFISYNVLPGCHLRTMLREMMLFHVRGFEAAEERVQQATALVNFLTQAQETRDEYRLWMRAELERIQEHAPGHLYHDDLAPINEPQYFTQFMSEAARQGLQYVGEADYFEMSDEIFDQPVRQTLQRLAGSRLLREQYLDFLKCRRFRQTLLCQREATVRPEPQAEQVTGFLVSSAASCTSGEVDLRPGVNCAFETPKGGKCQTDLAPGKAALSILGSLWPMALKFEDLLGQIRQRLDQAGVRETAGAVSAGAIRDFLLRLYAGGVVEFRTWLPPVASRAGARPVVHPVARWQAAHADSVASLFHIAVKVEDEVGRFLLASLDGTLDRPGMLAKLWDMLKSRNALDLRGGGEEAAKRELELKLEENLQKLARLGLLAG